MNMNKRDRKTLKEKTLVSSIDMNERDRKTLKEKTLVSSIDMNERDLEKLSKSELIKMLLKQKKSKKVHNHEDLLDNDPFKDEVAQRVAQREPAKRIKPRDPKTGRFVRINPEVPKQPALSRLRDAKGRFISRRQSQPVVQQAPNQIRIKPSKPNRPPPPPPILQLEEKEHITDVPSSK